MEQDRAEEEAAAAAAKAAEARRALMRDKRENFFRRLKSYSPRFHFRKRPFTALDGTKYGWRDTHLVGKKDPRTCILQCDACQGKMFVITFDPNSDNPKGIFILDHV